jgi:hypothetical protein
MTRRHAHAIDVVGAERNGKSDSLAAASDDNDVGFTHVYSLASGFQCEGCYDANDTG